MSSDPYVKIYKLIRQGNLMDALNTMLLPSRDDLYEPYKDDINHSWYVVGDIYFNMEIFDSAIIAFKKSLADRPEDHQALLALANCYFEINDPAKSEEYLREALKYSDRPILIYNLGCALFDQEKYSEALIFFRRVLPTDLETYDLAQKNIQVTQDKIR